MKRSLNLVSSILKAPCNDLARGFFLSASRLFYRIALIYYQFTFGNTMELAEVCLACENGIIPSVLWERKPRKI